MYDLGVQSHYTLRKHKFGTVMKGIIFVIVSALLLNSCVGESCLKYLLRDGDIPHFVDCFINIVADAVSVTEREIPSKYVRDPFAPNGLTVPKIIRKEKLNAEEHHVETEDGYILTMHRIPGKKGAPPVFLQHGLIASSLDWVLGGSKYEALAFRLHDEGYDVWMGNARGNIYSQGHKNLTSDDEKYWDFSWQEMGMYDIPAEIDYIQKKTNQKIIYVGYSMGSTMSYVMASERPDTAKKLKAIYSLSPVVYMKNVRTLTAALAPSYKAILEILNYLGIYGFHTLSLTARTVFHFACNFLGLGFEGCIRMMDGVIGISAHQLNWDMLWDIETHVPSGIGAKVFAHYAQNVNWGRFAKYDYGSEKNLKVYKSESPPDFKLEKINVPVGLIYAFNDVFADPADVKLLLDTIPKNIILNHTVTDTRFSHVDFMYSKRSSREVTDHLISSMKQFKDK
ncbi:hypothetical protein QAD02_006251 [Eretmocerus hayati]|uniref:Uncharacterized protein n=1 Tax=Eretmocerus hayati TaxID=131215 RepID=A0ACC2N0S1_9HYME|nr:hypothetical protein QAD02_006251 [Eretmocerus hayati]